VELSVAMMAVIAEDTAAGNEVRSDVRRPATFESKVLTRPS